MPLVKTYKRYSALSNFGIVGSTKCNCILTSQQEKPGKAEKYALCAILEDVAVWNVKKGEKVIALKGDKHEVVAMCISPDNKVLAVGYNDGSIKLWSLTTWSSTVNFCGHKSTITSLAFDKNGSRLVSGSRDTTVIVWDIVSERGLFRLKGHKGPVTCCRFMKDRNILVTSSKDTFVKFWDLDTQHCFLTLVGHRSEVWQFCLFKDDSRLLTGSSDSELRLWKIEDNVKKVPQLPGSKRSLEETDELENDNGEVPLTCSLIGSCMRQSRERIISMVSDERYLLCHGGDSILELFKISNEDEINLSMKKRRKKLRKKEKEKPEAEQQEVSTEQSVDDEISKLQIFNFKQTLRSCDFTVESGDALKVLLLYTNNSFGFHKIDLRVDPLKSMMIATNLKHSHRSDARTLAFNSDATCILSGSGESLKIWNRSTQACIRTMESDYCLCSFFIPGDRHVMIGSKSGKLQLFDIAAGTLLESVTAHTGAIWGISLAPDKRGFVSGSADQEVKFWEFELVDDEAYSSTSKRLSISHTRTMKMAEEVLGVLYSPDQRLLAVSLLDCTVKVFFADTLKFFLSLYGHKFPVLCMDISLDSTLLITGSADKNIKLWGLDFGDCHKSIFAHDDSITCVKFVAKTHYFFSASKDKVIKYWDADKYETIMSLQGHHDMIWAMTVSAAGEFLVTASHDKSIRLWQRTEELIVVEDEKEQEREEGYEKSLAESGETVIPGENNDDEAEFAGKKTMESVKAAERIMEAIMLCKEEEAKIADYKEMCARSTEKVSEPAPNPILKAFGNLEPYKYVLEELKRVRSSELEESLLVLPFSYVIDLLQLINRWLKNSWEVELCSRCMFFLLKIHHGQISSSKDLFATIESLRENSLAAVRDIKEHVGFNLAGLRFLQSELESRNVTFFGDAKDKIRENQKKKRKTLLTFR